MTPSFPTRRSSDLFHAHRLQRPAGKDLFGDAFLREADRHVPIGVEDGVVQRPRQHRRLRFRRSEEHTSELQSLMRHSYAVFCLKTQTSDHTYELQLHISITYAVFFLTTQSN